MLSNLLLTIHFLFHEVSQHLSRRTGYFQTVPQVLFRIKRVGIKYTATGRAEFLLKLMMKLLRCRIDRHPVLTGVRTSMGEAQDHDGGA